MTTLRRIRVAPREATVPPVMRATPPVPRTAAEAEPYSPGPDPGAATVAHRANRLRGWLARAVAWVDRVRRQQQEAAIREAWANGYRGGRLVERTEVAAHIRAELVRGAYDWMSSADAIRKVLRHLAEERQEG